MVTLHKSPVSRPPRTAHAARPALPSAHTLDKTHHDVLQRLEQLATLVLQLGDAGLTPALRALAADICSYFDGPARAHHEAEEQALFPRLQGHPDPALLGHVRRLQQEHGWLEDDWLELGPQLQAVARGFSWADADALRLAVPAFAQLYRDHIALEEAIVYPAARA